jgi:hypothetical protein
MLLVDLDQMPQVLRVAVALAPMNQRQALVVRDGEQPGAKPRSALETVHCVQGPQDRLLEGVLGVMEMLQAV